MAPIDPSTIEAASKGNAAARSCVVAALQASIFSLAMRMLSHRPDAEDVTQEALLKILASLDSFRGESQFSTWAHAVASRVILDYRRGAYRKEVVSFDAFAADLAEGLEPHAVERSEDSVYLGQVQVGCARALLLCLDGEHRLAYVVGQVMGLSGAEGAQICGISAEAFRKRLSRARQLVESALSENCGFIRPEAACRCHRRLTRATALGRVDPQAATVDPQRLREVIAQMQTLSERVAAYSSADPGEVVSADLAQRLRTMS